MSDPQDPLPEGRWLWRRIFIWFTNLATLGGVAFIIMQLRADPDELAQIALWLLVLNALNNTYYLIAPSAEHIVRTVQAGRVLRVPRMPGREPRP